MDTFKDILVWSPNMALGIASMDEAHQAMLADMASLVGSTDSQFEVALTALVARIERDFREEEEQMERIGFAGLPLHREQHARVLSALHHSVPDAMRGEMGAARRVVALMAPWFADHLHRFDKPLAAAVLSDQESAGQAALVSNDPTDRSSATEPVSPSH